MEVILQAMGDPVLVVYPDTYSQFLAQPITAVYSALIKSFQCLSQANI